MKLLNVSTMVDRSTLEWLIAWLEWSMTLGHLEQESSATVASRKRPSGGRRRPGSSTGRFPSTNSQQASLKEVAMATTGATMSTSAWPQRENATAMVA